MDNSNDGSVVAIYKTAATLFVVNHAKFPMYTKELVATSLVI